MSRIDIPETFYSYDESLKSKLRGLSDQVRNMRRLGKLSPDVLYRIRRYFRIKNIYHSNAIEGNNLEVGETRQVVELGLTITGKPLKDQAEARNLSDALDFLEQLAGNTDNPILENDIRQLHAFVLNGISETAGAYRTGPVEISGSKFKPPGPESVSAQMQEFGAWINAVSLPGIEKLASVEGILAAAVAHTWFVTIHPFIDGNGRVARLLMNLILMRYGFPIAIISKEDRLRYYDALEQSQATDLTPFIVLLTECIEESLEEYINAAEEQREQAEWAQSLVQKFTEPEKIRSQNEYEIWRNAMELLKSYFRQTVNILNEATDYGENIYFKDFGSLEFQKYLALNAGESAKRTWFFRIDFRLKERSARYLFFFGSGARVLRNSYHCAVTLHVAREEPPNSYYYERLESITALNVPDLIEVGYEMSKERFVLRKRSGRPSMRRVEEFGKQFFEDVVNKHFKA